MAATRRALRAAGESGLTRTDIRDVFRRHLRTADIQRALTALAEAGHAKSQPEETRGRPTERWFALNAFQAISRDTISPTSSLDEAD